MTERPKLAAFRHRGTHKYGLVTDDGVVDLSSHHARRWPTLREVIADSGLKRMADEGSARSPDLSTAEISYEPPIPSPQKIICVGVNYPERNEEYKDSQQPPKFPSLFVRFPSSFVGHGVPLMRPRESEELDYEGEIAIVIGKGGRRISEATALDHIAALSLCNDGSVRDWIRHGKFNVTQGKNFDGSGAWGPWLIPYDSEAQIADITIETRVNGEVRQRDRTSRMQFSFATLIAYISTFTTLATGDVIVTGTPAGAGARRTPPVWLKPGDVVEVEAEGIGVLRNPVSDEF
jgi:2-keto-4-pentenoate hydratase/2-oxohepta-3-ene-1,7-dioic acid hydratase in catechol pathway